MEVSPAVITCTCTGHGAIEPVDKPQNSPAVASYYEPRSVRYGRGPWKTGRATDNGPHQTRSSFEILANETLIVTHYIRGQKGRAGDKGT